MASTKTRAHTPTEAHIQSYAEKLLAIHGLTNWKVEFDNAYRRAGVCSYGTRTISFSRRILRAVPLDESLDTVRHEVAHAIVGLGAGHGPVWKKKCVELGGKPNRCLDVSQLDRTKVGYRYEGACPANHKYYAARMPQGLHTCPKCRQEGKTLPQRTIVYRDTKTGERLIVHRNKYIRPSVVFGAAAKVV